MQNSTDHNVAPLINEALCFKIKKAFQSNNMLLIYMYFAFFLWKAQYDGDCKNVNTFDFFIKT